MNGSWSTEMWALRVHERVNGRTHSVLQYLLASKLNEVSKVNQCGSPRGAGSQSVRQSVDRSVGHSIDGRRSIVDLSLNLLPQ